MWQKTFVVPSQLCLIFAANIKQIGWLKKADILANYEASKYKMCNKIKTNGSKQEFMLEP